MSTSPLFQPIFFTPIYKDYLWGGTNIAKRFKRLDTPVPCAESWEISAHKDGMSIVSDGVLKGQSLAELAKTFGRELLGSRSPAETKFPLLIKIIDARENLSVQIHPSLCDITADKDEIKNEFKRIYIRSHLSTYLDYDSIERMINIARINVEAAKVPAVEESDDDEEE